MIPKDPKALLDFLAAIAAFVAAVLWFFASRHPVAHYVNAAYGDLSKELAPVNAKIQRGAKLSSWAALSAGISALAQCVALLLPN